jgi:succinate dehydrogenase flavin-adding protein (antitoxin of CptAB toxin-antitoxin module)
MTAKEHEDTVDEQDTILLSLMSKYFERSIEGQRKYGTNLDRKDIDLMGWLNHLQEELMDASLYIEKLKKTI